MADVTLTAALRSNLLSLQGTQKLLDSTQLRLATGKKVNSALDDANAFFASQSLNFRASDLSRRLDAIGQGIQVLKAADNGITLITDYLEQLQAVATEALEQANASGGAPADQTQLEGDFADIKSQMNDVVNDAGYRGTNLLDSGTLNVSFNEDGSDFLQVTGVDYDDGGALAVADPTGNWTGAAAVQTTLDSVTAALNTVRAQARTFGSNLNILQSRETFTQNMINTLQEGSDKLTLADQNEEGAKLLSLQTAQQLGITSLSLASQAQQSVLRLF